MIIEFYGAPGAGKTYFATQLTTELSCGDIKAEDPVELGRSRILYKFRNKCAEVAIAKSPAYSQLRNELLDIVCEYSNVSAKFNNVRIASFIDTIVFYSFWYQYYLEKKGVYIFDEGIVHQYVNMMANYDIPIALVEKLNKKIPYIPTSILISCSIEENLFSIRKRNRHVCYIDDLSGQTLVDCVNAYMRACNEVAHFFKSVTLNRQTNTKKNIEIIRKVINS